MGLLGGLLGGRKVSSANTQNTTTYAFSNQGAGPAYNVAGNTAPVQITSTDFNAIERAFDFSSDALAQNAQVLRASLSAGQDLAAQALQAGAAALQSTAPEGAQLTGAVQKVLIASIVAAGLVLALRTFK